ncbi:hypothetical protein ACHAW6_006002, partial [Cyclotella cf. meneghiniana]
MGKHLPNRIIIARHQIITSWNLGSSLCITESGCVSVFHLLQQLYKISCALKDDDGSSTKKSFSQAKYDKKLKGAMQSSHIIAICVETNTKNPLAEEVCSVEMVVQNMHLMASVHGIGVYWSSGAVNGASNGSSPLSSVNPKALTQFFYCGESVLCLGWFFVGDYF